MQTSCFNDLTNLREDYTPAVMRCQSNGVNVHINGFFFRAYVSSHICVRATNNGYVDFEWLVMQDFFPVDLQQLDH